MGREGRGSHKAEWKHLLFCQFVFVKCGALMPWFLLLVVCI
ncbi:hypothetical protein MANES_13G043750v8 [Manihot esculenta]|uniref:Uncharacterized protein n=1 Tax=Manihot esculenta TaxID=3983 RepID=A0ACB7GK28_MANES|nr:hypothetical protein MANES_13G043750v8 [Manihot esculenta]